jgi:hypothetical protein
LCRLIAVPEYRRRAAAAAEPAKAVAAPGGLEADDNCSPIDLIIYSYEPPDCPAAYAQNLRLQWLKVLQRLHKAAEVRVCICVSTQTLFRAYTAGMNAYVTWLVQLQVTASGTCTHDTSSFDADNGDALECKASPLVLQQATPVTTHSWV